MQAEDSSSRHASQMQAHEEAAAAAKKAAFDTQAELKKVFSPPTVPSLVTTYMQHVILEQTHSWAVNLQA